MLTFLTPSLWVTLVGANIIVGGAWAIYRLYHDLSGPARFTDDDSAPVNASSSYSSGPSGPNSDE